MTREMELNVSQTARSRGFSPLIGGDVAQVAGHDRHVEGDARPVGVVAHRARLSTVDARRKRRVAVEPTHHAVDVGMHQRHVVVDELLEVVDVFSVMFFVVLDGPDQRYQTFSVMLSQCMVRCNVED